MYLRLAATVYPARALIPRLSSCNAKKRERASVFPPSKKRKGGGRYNFSMRSKQIKHSNDHIKGNQVRKRGGGAPWYPPLGETLEPGILPHMI